MNKLSQYNLGLFLTEKNGLGTWARAGILSREIAPYNLLADYFQKIYFFTDGDEDEYRYQTGLADNIEIVVKDRGTPRRKYYWQLPLRHWKKIQSCHFFKTNQLKARAALLAKILNPRAKLIVRTGYLPSLFEKDPQGKIPWKIKLWEKIAYRLCNLALVTSPADRDYLLKNYHIKSSRIGLIANYIDTDLFSPNSEKRITERIVFVGRLSPQKNLPLLIEALAGTGLELDIVGVANAPEQRELKANLSQLAHQRGVPLHFLGVVPNEKLPSILNCYAIFVLPSLYEGTPKALLEAMSCGLACLVTDVAGSRELIHHGQTGLIAPARSEDLKSNILKLKNNSNLRETLGENARKFVINNFSLNSQIQKEIHYYEQLI